MTNKKIKLHCNSPVVIGFVCLCTLALGLHYLTNGYTDTLLFSVYRAPLRDPLTYARLLLHVCGHANWSHYIGNMMLLLVIGPLLEEKYGSKNLLWMICLTALTTGLVNFIFFPTVQLLGASGVVFAMILASSLTSIRENTIPITLVLVAVLYLGQEFYNMFVQDDVSQITHIIGGFVGASCGYWGNKKYKN